MKTVFDEFWKSYDVKPARVWEDCESVARDAWYAALNCVCGVGEDNPCPDCPIAGESPDAWMGGVPLNRLAQYLYESRGGKWWASIEHVSQAQRSLYFNLARGILTGGKPLPEIES